MATEQEYKKFKSLLEYFVAHLEYVGSKSNISHCGYEKYIHPLVASKIFKKTGTGYSGHKIQKQIAAWDEYSVGKIAINCTPQYGKNYKTRLCYLNWISTGLNVTAQWHDDHIISLDLENYQDGGKWTTVVSPVSLSDLGLYDDRSPNDKLKYFFDSFIFMLQKHKQAQINFKEKDNPETELIKPSGNIENTSTNFWWLNANPKMWSMSAAPIGEVQDYTLYNDKQHKRKIFQNFLDAQVGDMIIGYESTPVKQIVALFQIAQAQDGERIYFKKIEHLASPVDLTVLQAQPELTEMEFFKNSQASLLKLSAAEYDCILNLIRDVNPLPQVRKIEKYDSERFLSEVFMTSAKYEALVRILKAKKNIILQGAPGVGKTFAAKRLAYSIMGEKDDSRIEFVQFHQNYSYEDFVMGYKPNENSFKLRKGIFYSFCQKAASDPEKAYFFIIDEINRGNMSKIFGELLMLIEKDYRDTSLTLAYDGLPFRVPKNLHIIGMMNTADRSLAMIDYALRRRFSFFDMEPGFESDGFKAYLSGLNSEKLDKLVDEIKSLNNAIAEDKSLGKGFCIGHSYLCGAETYSKEWLQGVVEYDILPMLAEYWFDELEKYEEWEKRLTEIAK